MTPAEPAADASLPAAVEELALWERFHIRLTTIFGAAVFLIITLMGWIFHALVIDAEVRALQVRMRAMAETVAAGVDPAWVALLDAPADMTRPEHAALAERFRAICADEPDITSIYVMRRAARPGLLQFVVDYVRDGGSAQTGELYDPHDYPRMLDGLLEPTFEARLYADKWGSSMSGYAPVRDAAGRGVAMVGVDVMASRVAAVKNHVRAITLGIYALSLALLAGIAWLVGRQVRTPITLVMRATSAIAGGDLDVRVRIPRRDEFGILGSHFDRMAAGLREREHIRATFGRYVSEEVARKILSHHDAAALGGEERFVTVLMTDLRGYSTICQYLPPHDIVHMLNAYMGAMGGLIDAHGGCVIEYLGDAILCVFGAPGDLPDHAEMATRCGIAMAADLATLNEEWERSGLAVYWKARGIERLAARTGIHSGRVVAGNVGSASRVKYAVIGDTVNVAARLETLNTEEGTEILVSGDVYDLLPASLQACMESRGERHVKGRDQPVRLYAVVPGVGMPPPRE